MHLRTMNNNTIYTNIKRYAKYFFPTVLSYFSILIFLFKHGLKYGKCSFQSPFCIGSNSQKRRKGRKKQGKQKRELHKIIAPKIISFFFCLQEKERVKKQVKSRIIITHVKDTKGCYLSQLQSLPSYIFKDVSFFA